MSSKKKEKGSKWLLTYSDMITLLLVYFIIFLSISSGENANIKIFISSLLGNIGFHNSGSSIIEIDKSFVTLGNQIQNLPAENVAGYKLNKDSKTDAFILNNLNITRKVRAVENREGVVISLFSDIFFEPDSNQLNYDSAKDILENIRQLIDVQNFQGEILINGHTDNIPYTGTQFQDNWELSMARALTVFNALRQIPFIYPLNTEKVSVHAYGENRPIESNDTPEGRSYNRRVDIILKR